MAVGLPGALSGERDSGGGEAGENGAAGGWAPTTQMQTGLEMDWLSCPTSMRGFGYVALVCLYVFVVATDL
jgi:hypothetical protein